MTLLLTEWGRDTQLTIKLGHLFTQFNFAKNSLELRLIDTGDKPAGHVGKRLAERRVQDLQNKLSLHYLGWREKKLNQEACQTCLYIQSMEQTTVISARLTLSPTRKVRVLRCWFSTVRTFFTSSLACSVAYNDPHEQITKYYMNLCIFYITKHTDLNHMVLHCNQTALNKCYMRKCDQKIVNCKPACWTAWFPKWEKPTHWLEEWSPSQQSSPTAAPELPP